MKKYIYLFIALIALSACGDNTDEGEKIEKCLVTKFNPATINVTGQSLFTSEFIYNSNNDLIKKLDFTIIQSGNSNTYNTELKSTTQIEYINGKPSKIVGQPDYTNFQTIEYLSYSNGRLSKKEIVNTNLTDNLSSKKTFEYSYNSTDWINSVVIKNYDSMNNLDLNGNTAVSYDTNGNVLSVITTTSNPTNPNYETKTVIEYSDYDSYKNPFFNLQVPFEDQFFIRFSPNNYRKYSRRYFVNNQLINFENKTFTYNYNDKNYPKIAEFKCFLN
ncbi:hypothetical protein ASG01_12160 [Chryseobacterium sp. Leaf180]|uniref:hypothetical protein n=1 Tax=Chryseobacterium sp. Leaf180 TaxID=1736289 RepID=UPI0006FF16AB|nr:hypothetical protein [Chryseobacterium sp. Leaf180]KQR92647.1 hypothetical protein ASG01_12160 [Chryseobacterium sp. Leaf180]